MKYAYITAINNSKYLMGLRVLCESLSASKSDYPLFVLVSSDTEKTMYTEIKKMGADIICVEPISISDSNSESNKHEYWNNTFFKLQIMNLTQFDKVLYIDSDMLVLNNLDKLFGYPGISATTGGKSAHPEYLEFNSGLMVIEPDVNEYEKLIRCIEPAIERKKAEGKGYGDQDVFNEYYKDWNEHIDHDLGEENNALCPHLDALMSAKGYKKLNQINVIHYVGPDKIWNNTTGRNLRLIARYIREGRLYTAKAWWLYMKWLKKVKHK